MSLFVSVIACLSYAVLRLFSFFLSPVSFPSLCEFVCRLFPDLFSSPSLLFRLLSPTFFWRSTGS